MIADEAMMEWVRKAQELMRRTGEMSGWHEIADEADVLFAGTSGRGCAQCSLLREHVRELRAAASSARDALSVAIKCASDDATDDDIAEHLVIKKLDAALRRSQS